MAENIGGTDLFSSGGHVWHWQPAPVADKRMTSVGVRGAARIVTAIGARTCLIAGKHGGPAVLKATGASRATADAALDTIEQAILAARDGGESQAWADDSGRDGDELVVTAYRPTGPRRYAVVGSTWNAWQFYTAEVVDLTGGET